MQIFQKLVRNEQHMALNAFLCTNINEYFYHVMWSKIGSNTAILRYFTWKYGLETYANFWIKAVCKIGNIYSEIVRAWATAHGQGKFGAGKDYFDQMFVLNSLDWFSTV